MLRRRAARSLTRGAWRLTECHLQVARPRGPRPSALLQRNAELGVDGKGMQTHGKLRDDPVQPMAIDVDRLADANLQRAFGTIVLCSEMQASTLAQQVRQLPEDRKRLPDVLEGLVEEDEVDAARRHRRIDLLEVEV